MKRKREACVVCRRYHKGCDGERPCGRCKELGFESICKGEQTPHFALGKKPSRWKNLHETFQAFTPTSAPPSSSQTTTTTNRATRNPTPPAPVAPERVASNLPPIPAPKELHPALSHQDVTTEENQTSSYTDRMDEASSPMFLELAQELKRLHRRTSLPATEPQPSSFFMVEGILSDVQRLGRLHAPSTSVEIMDLEEEIEPLRTGSNRLHEEAYMISNTYKRRRLELPPSSPPPIPPATRMDLAVQVDRFEQSLMSSAYMPFVVDDANKPFFMTQRVPDPQNPRWYCLGANGPALHLFKATEETFFGVPSPVIMPRNEHNNSQLAPVREHFIYSPKGPVSPIIPLRLQYSTTEGRLFFAAVRMQVFCSHPQLVFCIFCIDDAVFQPQQEEEAQEEEVKDKGKEKEKEKEKEDTGGGTHVEDREGIPPTSPSEGEMDVHFGLDSREGSPNDYEGL